jgi:hypothetical protein
MAMMTWHDAGNNRIEKAATRSRRRRPDVGGEGQIEEAATGSSWMMGHPWAVQG